jgi:hypothetical protein
MAKRKCTINNLQSTTQITKHRVTRIPIKPGGEHRCYGRVGSFCTISDTRYVNLVTNPVISHELGKDREVLTTKWNISMVICDTDVP